MSGIVREYIEQEIKWHSEHPDTSGKPKDFEDGFIAGMRHILEFFGNYWLCEHCKTWNFISDKKCRYCDEKIMPTSSCTCWRGDPASAPPCQCHPPTPPRTQRAYLPNRDETEHLLRAAKPLVDIGNTVAATLDAANEAEMTVAVPARLLIALAHAMPEIAL